jgi:hypothetical protein
VETAFRILLASFLALALPALAQQPNRAEGFGKLAAGTRIALMPADIELFEISAGGVIEPRADWTSAAQAHVRESFKARKAKMGVQVIEVEDDAAEPVLELNRLHGAVSSAIAVHHFGMFQLPTKNAKLDWTLGPEVSYVREKTGADYALFTFIRDTYASSERKAAMVIGALFGVGLGGGIQQAYVSLVDLKSGNVMWANRVFRASGDLREREPAQETVDTMLTGLLEEVGPPPTAPRPRSIRDW